MQENKEKDKKVLERIEENIAALKDKSSTLYFFVADSKNIPNAKMGYIYEMANTLQANGYKVCMLYQLENEYTEKELNELNQKEMPVDENRVFTGVRGWLGDKYADLPHLNISLGTWSVSPSDFLFIPEVFAGLMKEVFKKKIPCKRVAILQNPRHITEFIPLGDQWANYGIVDAIVPSQSTADFVTSIFKYVKPIVINPYIPEYFRKPLKAKKLIVDVVCKHKADAEHVIKLFYWKYPMYQFIPFRYLVDFNRETYAQMLQESAFTIWLDYETSFGINALESIRSGNVVVGKIPEIIPEWMDEGEDLKLNGLWVDDLNKIPDALAMAINKWLEDGVAPEMQKAMDETSTKYGLSEWNKNVTEMVDKLIAQRLDEFKAIKSVAEKNNKTEEEEATE